MEPYRSFLDSYPSSSSPLQLGLGVTKHQPNDDHHFIHHSNAPFLGLSDMEVPAAPLSASYSLDGTSNSGGARDIIGNNSLLDIGSSEEVGKAKEMERQPKRTAPNKKMKKPRYAFQTRSHVDILDDGYRWRKYGQKAVKNNKFPRSYYRCTFQGCNVKKQVQRLTKDEGVVLTTYEGKHSHPIEQSTDNFEHILSQFQIYTSI